MSKNKKIVLIVVLTIIILAVIGVLVYFIAFNKDSGDEISISNIEENNSKINALYEELQNTEKYSFTTTLDEKNKVYYAKKNQTAYVETTREEIVSKFLVKDGNSYLIVDEEKTYYTYQNNEMDLNKITDILQEIKDNEYTKGTEEIEGKQYEYEEYDGITGFLITSTDEQEGKTRFYFDNNKLLYIKTIIGDSEELLKVNMSKNTDNAVFEIPSDYNGI